MSNIWTFMWDVRPVGVRFQPTDDEFVNHYLTNYLRHIKDDFCVIPIVDDLFKRTPSELPNLFRESSIIRSRDSEWWFLSTLSCKGKNPDKFSRCTRNGYWKSTGKPKVILNGGDNRKIAEKRNLVFCENPRNAQTNWVIHEYYLQDIALDQTLGEQRKYVLCHLVNRQYDYTETSMNMEVDLEFEEQRHGFSEDMIQAMMRSLTDVPLSPATNTPVHEPQEGHWEDLMDTVSIDKNNIQFLLQRVSFPTDEESTHSDEFSEDMMSISSGEKYYLNEYLNQILLGKESAYSYEFEQLLEPEETSRVVLNENRRARPLGTLEEYVFIDETTRFVEKDIQREEDPFPNEHYVSYLHMMEAQSADFRGYDHRSTAVIERPQSTPPGRYHDFKEGKAKGAPIAWTQNFRPRAGNEKMPITFWEKNQVVDGGRSPFDYLVNLGAGIILIVFIILWLLRY